MIIWVACVQMCTWTSSKFWIGYSFNQFEVFGALHSCRTVPCPLFDVVASFCSSRVIGGYIPVALSNSEGAGSVWVLAHLSGAHLYIQVLGNKPPTAAAVLATFTA